MSGPTISQQKILAASQGDASALLEVLQQMAGTTTQTQAATGTTPAVAASSSAAKVPPQATGAVSVLNGAYVVQITNPGAQPPLSALQTAQANSQATALTPIRPVTSIFHQIRASTSPAFNVNSNTQTFGGGTGSTQTLFTLTGLSSGTWYIQFRSSYDGTNFNLWKNANGGTALGGLVNQVTTETAAFSDWAVFVLPGGQIAGFGEGLVPDQGVMGLASQLFSSGLIAIAGPNGFVPQGNGIYGAVNCDVDIQVPTDGTPATSGIPDYPVEILMKNGISGSGNLSPGTASVFAFGFNPTGDNVSLYTQPGGNTVWAVFKLPGGAQFAVGQGKNFDGAPIYVPPELTWVSASRMMSIVSLTDATDIGNVVEGYGAAAIAGLSIAAKYQDDAGHQWSTTGNWMAIAWQLGTDIVTSGGNQFLQIALQGGHALIFGAGQTPSGTPIVLPAGYTSAQMLSTCTPGGAANTGHHMRGVAQCSFIGLTPWLQYTDNSNTWDGPVNWILAAWK